MQHLSLVFTILLMGSMAASSAVLAKTKNGFDVDGATIPVGEILSGGPPRDGIPAIDQPKFIAADRVGFLTDDDRVLGIVFGDQVKAYPIKILDWHEIVNDSIGDTYFAITYCPLCGTGVAFAANKGGQRLSFGVSGLLYNSDVLLYDRNTESLWSQIKAEAVSGELKGSRLKRLPLQHTTWGDWRTRYQNSLVLSTDTGHFRDYERSPYGDYAQSRTLYFSVSHKAPAFYHPKEQVIGLEVDGEFKAYPFVELSKQGSKQFKEVFAGKSFTVHWNEEARSAFITDDEEVLVATTTGFWFAWYTFHPDTAVYSAP